MNIFYRILRSIVRLVLQIYFKKVSLQGQHHIDPDKPMLLAVNHPNSFLEACVLACWLKIPLHFIVRGDVFHPAFRWFFKWTHQIPIYRFKDGFSKLRNNTDTFQNCYERLKENKKILIFSEGSTKWTKQLRPLQRGTGHIATGALRAYPQLPLEIVPVGVNYEDVFKFRSTIEVKISRPLEVRTFMKEKHPVQTITDALKERMSECVVHLERTEDIERFNGVCDVKGVFKIQSSSKIERQFKIANAFNENKVEPHLLEAIDTLLNCKEKLGMISLSESHRKRKSSWPIYLWAPVHLLLMTVFAGPAYLARYTARKVYDHPAFEIPIRLGFLMIYYVLFIVVMLVIIGLTWDIWAVGVATLLFGSLCFISIYSYVNMRKWRDQIRWNQDSAFPNKESYIQEVLKSSL